MLMLSISMGIALICFPFLLFWKNMSSVTLSYENCVSCSVLGKYCALSIIRGRYFTLFLMFALPIPLP